MGLFQDLLKKNVIDPVVSELSQRSLAKAAGPSVTEVPPILQVGAMFTGGSRRKYNSLLDFDTLRTFSVVYDVARACINHRKRQISNLEWSIVPRDDEADAKDFKKQIQKATLFFEQPSNGMDFKTWNDCFIEDLLVFDAGVFWKDKTYGGELKELLPVDGSTIRIKVGPDGSLPEAPEVAYQQVLFGEVAGEYTSDEMIYKMMNPRNNTPYGLGPLECLVIGVDTALRSQMYNANMLSEGTVPEGFFGVPENWTPDQIKDYQMWFDTMLAGNSVYNSRIKFMPGGKGVGYMPTKKAEDMRYLELEKWLLMKTCALFDTQPQDIGFVDNATPGNAESQQELGNERGLVPTANFLKQTYSQIIARDMNMPDLKFEWKGLQVVDNEFELDRSKALIEHGAMTVNELRIAQGFEPFEDEIADKPMIYTTAGPVLLEIIQNEADANLVPKELVPADGSGNAAPGQEGAGNGANQAEQDGQEAGKAAAELDDLEKWQTKAQNFLRRGKTQPAFKSDHIEEAVQNLIRARLVVAKSRDEIVAAFRPFIDDATERSLISRALNIRSDIGAFQRKKHERTGTTKARD